MPTPNFMDQFNANRATSEAQALKWHEERQAERVRKQNEMLWWSSGMFLLFLLLRKK